MNNRFIADFGVFENYLYAITRNASTGVEVWRTSVGSRQSDWAQVNSNAFSTIKIKDYGLFIKSYNGYLLTAAYNGVSPKRCAIWRTSVGSQQSDWDPGVDGVWQSGSDYLAQVYNVVEWNGYLYCACSVITSGVSRAVIMRYCDGRMPSGVRTTIG